jgi:2-keto-4-pentenoate hydratase
MKHIPLLANKFIHAFYNREWRGELEPNIDSLSIAQAYEVQDLVAEMRTQRGEEVVGYKVGCTSEAIRTQFGISEPISGRLFQPHIHANNSKINWTDYVNCAIEPEMVLTIGEDLAGVSLSDDRLIEAIAYVSPGIELHNYRFWIDPPSLQELICSGGIHAGLVIGDATNCAKKLTFINEGFSVYKNGQLITEGPASEIMRGPIHSLRWLVESLTRRGLSLKKGSLVIPGSPVELVRIERDCELRVDIEGVGSTLTHFVGGHQGVSGDII